MFSRPTFGATFGATFSVAIALAAAQPTSLRGGEPLPGTEPLVETTPLDQVMVAGLNRYASRELEVASRQRESRWNLNYTSASEYERSLEPYRREFAEIIGAVDERREPTGIELVATVDQPALIAENDLFAVHAVRWPTLEGVDAEGLLLLPKTEPIARIVAIPDADWTPEMIAGLAECPTRYAGDLAAAGCEVLVPTLINRGHQFSGNASIGKSTTLSHREFVYRQAFELGRHVIGFEVQKVLAAVDQFERRGESEGDLPLGVVGVSEGGLLGLYAAALDTRIDGVVVSGYFNERTQLWREPIDRNVWSLLRTFGDAELAGMIAPRSLYVENDVAIPEVLPLSKSERGVAAPGEIHAPNGDSVQRELRRASLHWDKMKDWSNRGIGGLRRLPAPTAGANPLQPGSIAHLVGHITQSARPKLQQWQPGPDRRSRFDPNARQKRQLDQLTSFAQRRLRLVHRSRDRLWSDADRSTVAGWERDADTLREKVHDQLIGRLPEPKSEPNPRTRKIIDEAKFVGYEVVLDVYPDVIASGILLLPKGIQEGERRPVVVCQHGLEGTPMDTISGPDSKAYRAYKSFSAELASQGFVVFAPQNPYRGGDEFRRIQRKSNPLGRTLFSYIIPQHRVILRWLSGLPQVDRDRIGFYGLSYGGKTAVRVPPLMPPSANEVGYALSICSADFNEWVAKNVSTDVPFSYVWTPEYEIFEWNMGNIANYAELGMLMAPRPFMVERGHHDGVGIDEWVAWEYAKVRRHYNQLGLSSKTEIEFFDGPHTINGAGTYRFLRRHLEHDEK